MCGHVGVAALSVNDSLKNAFNNLLYLDVLRGEDSTGVAAVSNAFAGNAEVEVFKEVGTASDLFLTHGKGARNKSLTFKNVSVYIGHNRAATQGKINVDNAHPFEFENVVGAHNGTVQQYTLRNFHGYVDYDVDSQIIYSHLSHTQDIDATWAGIDGAAALVWWDKPNRRLNMIRNNQRPLFVFYTEDDKAVLWASEPWMVQVAAMRNGIKLKDGFEIAVNTLYTFHAITETGADYGKMRHVERAVSPFVPKPVTTYYGNNFPFRGRNGNGYDDYDGWDNWHQSRDGSPPANSPDTKNPPKKPEDKDEFLYVVVSEFHNNSGYPKAFGHTMSGKEVMINILAKDLEASRKSILGRGKTGYWKARIPFRKSVGTPGTYWCNFSELTFMKLKKHAYLECQDSGSWQVHVKKEVNGDKSEMSAYAPWHNPSSWLTEAGYKERTETGCSCCGKVPDWDDRNDLVWVDREYFVCKECKQEPWVQDWIAIEKQATA